MQFSDESAACMVISDTIYVMLLTHARFAGFAPHPRPDAHAATAMQLALSAESREEVNGMVSRAAAAGGAPDVTAPQEMGFMFQRTCADPDGHVWEIFWMDPEHVQATAT